MRTTEEFIDIIEKWGFYKWDRGRGYDYEWVHSSGRWIMHLDYWRQEYSLLDHFGDSIGGMLNSFDHIEPLLKMEDKFIKLNRNHILSEVLSCN